MLHAEIRGRLNFLGSEEYSPTLLQDTHGPSRRRQSVRKGTQSSTQMHPSFALRTQKGSILWASWAVSPGGRESASSLRAISERSTPPDRPIPSQSAGCSRLIIFLQLLMLSPSPSIATRSTSPRFTNRGNHLSAQIHDRMVKSRNGIRDRIAIMPDESSATSRFAAVCT